MAMKLEVVQVGDTLTRMLAGTVPMPVIVGEVKDDTIKVGSQDGRIKWQDGWEFDRKTGMEIDDYLAWGPKYGITGSFIE